ncbi:MAG TPA: CvpA family protein [Ignavibacteriaceae bacterium]|nr:CvpA family protein [Ignavibacteriaceae bacterium]
MNLLDIIILIIALSGFVLGYKDGFIRKLVGFVGFILAVYLSIQFAAQLGKGLENAFGIEYYLSELIAGAVIFILIIIIFSVIKRLIHPHDKVNNLVNQLLGGIIGMLQILFFLSAILYILNVFDVPSKNSKKNSLIYEPVYSIIPATINFVSNYTPSAKKRIKEYINDKDSLNDKSTVPR